MPSIAYIGVLCASQTTCPAPYRPSTWPQAAEPAAAPEPEPAATAKADAAETAVSSKTPRSGDNYTITNNITNNIGYLNQGNDLRENHLGLDEWRSGGW